jgi:alpha-N-arabinofuranosidase
VAGLITTAGGDNRFYNNIFVGSDEEIIQESDPLQIIGYGLSIYNGAERPLFASGNIYLKNAKHYEKEVEFIEELAMDPQIRLVEKENGYNLQMTLPQTFQELNTRAVNTDLLGKAFVPDLPYENRDGSPLKIDKDYLGRKRHEKNPSAGPFEITGENRINLRVWEPAE